jgi:hypothetical protein
MVYSKTTPLPPPKCRLCNFQACQIDLIFQSGQAAFGGCGAQWRYVGIEKMFSFIMGLATRQAAMFALKMGL